MKCSKCGCELREGAKFCTKCGAVAPIPNKPQNLNNKNHIPKWIWITLISVVALIIIVCGVIMMLGGSSSSSNKEVNSTTNNNSTSSDTNSIELQSDILGTWYTITGADDHYITISNDGTLTFFDELIDGVDTMTGKYIVVSNNKITVAFEDDIDEFEFEYANGILIRYEDGECDGYTYSKDKPSQTVSSDTPTNTTNDSNSSSTTSTTDSPKPTTPTNIDYTLEHLKKAIQVWSNYGNYGAPCGFSEEWVYPEAWEFLNESQAQWVNDLRCSECCCSISEAKAHLGQYLDPNMYDNFSNNNFVEYRGFLYIALGGVGYTEYDMNLSESNVNRTAYNKIHVIIKQYGSGGNYYCDTRIDFEYKNGSYKIIKVTDLV